MPEYLEYMNSPHGVQQIFTREKIDKMSASDFEKYEKRIHTQQGIIGIPSKKELSEYNSGKLYIWHIVNDNKVCSKCKVLDGTIFENIEDIPDDLHLNCRCYIEKIDLNYC